MENAQQKGKKMVTNEQLGWMAGIADGEGSFYLSDTRDTRNRPVVKYSFAVGNTNLSIILEVKRIFEELVGHTVNYCPTKGRGNRKQSWVIALTSLDDLAIFCNAVMPYLIGKIEQANTMLQFVSIGKAYGNHWTGSNKRIYKQRLSFVSKMKALNKYRVADSSIPLRETERQALVTGEETIRTARRRAEAAETTARLLPFAKVS